MSASRSLPRSSQARASEQRRSSHKARRTESIGLAFGDTASFSPRKPWFSCSKAGGSKTCTRPRQRPRPLRRVRRMGTTPGRDSGACAGRVLLAGRFVRVTSANARRASSYAPWRRTPRRLLPCTGTSPTLLLHSAPTKCRTPRDLACRPERRTPIIRSAVEGRSRGRPALQTT